MRRFIIAAVAVLFLCAVQSNAQILHRKKKVDKSTSAENTAEPDKILYDRAMDDIKHGRHEVGRLNLQTLINTYPDSEYLAKAKLAIADSYYKEGGTANMTQAVAGYKDFDVFFPFLPEAAYAQLQVANAHYQQMEKPDRDRTQAKEAEDEFQTFLQKYPKDPLVPQAEQKLRDVQEVLAEGDYRIAYYYYVKGDRRAAASRLLSLTNRYPLYSRADRALWMMGDIFEKSEKKEIAGRYYAQIIKNYPKSEFVGPSKTKLTALKVPIPQPDPKALARMTAEQNTPRSKTPLYKKPMDMLHGGPTGEMQTAARFGAPNMDPESDSSAGDILAGGNHSTIGNGAGGAGNGIVATVQVGDTSKAAEGNSTPAVTPDTTPDSSTPPADKNATGVAGGTAGTSVTPATDAGTATTGAAATPSGTDAATQADSSTTANPDSSSKESTSKKKKGVHKLIPW